MNGWKANQTPDTPEYGVGIYTLSGTNSLGPVSARTAADFLILHFETASFVELSWGRGNLSFGEFMIWLSDERALVRLDEHREHYATDSSITYDIRQGSVTFQDVGQWGFGTEIYTQNFDQTVTKAQALAAALHWLETGEKSESLQWT